MSDKRIQNLVIGLLLVLGLYTLLILADIYTLLVQSIVVLVGPVLGLILIFLLARLVVLDVELPHVHKLRWQLLGLVWLLLILLTVGGVMLAERHYNETRTPAGGSISMT